VPGFSRESRPLRSTLITFRVTADEKELLGKLAKHLNLRGQSEVIRRALDHYLASKEIAGLAAKLRRE
jgi:predicted transcriptional regulator